MEDRGTHILDAIGNTPMIKIRNLSQGEILAKAEFLTPGGSIKDRIAAHIIGQAEKRGDLRPGSVIIEATSGNTGIGMVLVGRQRGYRVIIIMPENMSEERKKLIRALGGELVLTPAERSLDGCLEKLEELKVEYEKDVFVPNQFVNPENPEAHYLTTGPEIWKQAGGQVDVFVAGVGSGGTLMGNRRYLKEKHPELLLVAVEPRNNTALLGREPGLHVIQGIGDGFVPPVVDKNLIDTVMTVTDEDAVETARHLAKNCGLLVGTSSGANVWCASHFADGKRSVVTVLPDRVERYFSSALI